MFYLHWNPEELLTSRAEEQRLKRVFIQRRVKTLNQKSAPEEAGIIFPSPAFSS